MLKKSLHQCPEIIANDGCRLRELMHPSNDGVSLPYSLAIAVVEPGGSTYKHVLKHEELYHVLNGQGVVTADQEQVAVEAGDAVLVPGGATQWVDNTGQSELIFACIVSPPWRAQDDLRVD